MIVTAKLVHSDVSALMRHMEFGSNKAMVRALRDASQAMQTAAVKGVAERVNLTQREIWQDLTLVRPGYAGSNMVAGIRLTKDFWNPSASKFNVVQKPAGAAATIWRGARTTYTGTFLMSARGGSGVFAHVKGADRKTLKKIFGVSASVEVMRPPVRDAVLLSGTTKFLVRFAHYARQVIAKQSFMD